jgi:hypothetical protein
MKSKYIIFTLFILGAIIPVLAQGAPPATLIDGGLSLLLAAGAAYGAKQLHNRRK